MGHASLCFLFMPFLHLDGVDQRAVPSLADAPSWLSDNRMGTGKVLDIWRQNLGSLSLAKGGSSVGSDALNSTP